MRHTGFYAILGHGGIRSVKYFLLAFIPSLAWAVPCDIPAALVSIAPGAEWTLRGTQYAGLNWLDAVQPKPTLQQVQDAQTACLATLTPAGILAGQRTQADSLFLSDAAANSKVLRSILLVVLDEINLLRQRDLDRSADVAAATSLADLKTRWAAEPSLTDRTVQQGRTAIQNKIDAGAAD